MKIVVDEMPKRETDCLFSEYSYDGYCDCKLSPGDTCCLSRSEQCTCLIAYRDMKENKHGY